MNNIYLIVGAVQTIVTLVVGRIIYLQNRKIEFLQKTEIDNIKSDFKRQADFIHSAETLFKMYDIEQLKKYTEIVVYNKATELKMYKEKIDTEFAEKDKAFRELLKFSLGIFSSTDKSKHEGILNEFFPENKKQISMYLKKLNIGYNN